MKKEITYHCKYCSLEKIPSDLYVNHPNCEEINTLHKEHVYEEFYKPQILFINNRRNQTKNIDLCCNNFTDIIMISVASLTEIYKTFASVFLVIFSPKSCSNQDCSLQALYIDQIFNTVSISIGLFTFCLFMMLYIIEIIREDFLKKNLIFNDKDTIGVPGIHVYQKKGTDYLERIYTPKKPFINFSFLFKSSKLSKLYKKEVKIEDYIINKNDILQNIKNNVRFYNNFIRKSANILIVTYLINVIFAIVAVKFYNDTQSAYISLFTNIILICPKLYSSYKITKDGEYNTNSVYLTKNLEYNDYNDKNKDKIEKIIIEKRVEFFKDPNNNKENTLKMREIEQLEFDKKNKETNLHIASLYGRMPNLPFVFI
jgi:hypothetical protein